MNKHLFPPLTGILALLLTCFLACDDPDAPGSNVPILTTGTAEAGGRTTATLSGSIVLPAGTSVGECGFLYSTVSSLPEAESTKVTVDPATIVSGTTFSLELTGLQPTTRYYYRLYATSGFTTLRGDILSFETSAAGRPVFGELVCSAVTESSADVQSLLTDYGGQPILNLGFSYWPVDDPTAIGEPGDQELFVPAVALPDSAASNVAFSATIPNLTPGRSYAVRPYGVNSVGTGYGQPVAFTTLAATTPVLSEVQFADSTEISVELLARVTDPGQSYVTEWGFCWNTGGAEPTIDGTHQSCTPEPDGTFRLNLADLLPMTTYQIRAYARNDQGVGYSLVRQFTTKNDPTAEPVVVTLAAAEVGEASARLRGTLASDGGQPVTASGFFWGTTPNPSTEGTRVEAPVTEGSLSYLLEGLERGTTYYYCAFAENVKGMATGEVLSFVTLDNRLVPTVETIEAAEVGETTARIAARLASDGGSPVTASGFCYGTDANPAPDGTQCEAALTDGAFAYDLSGLAIGTTYYYCAYATNEIGTGYGQVRMFTTLDNRAVPDVTAAAATSVTESPARLSGRITSEGGSEVTASGFCYGTDANPATNGTRVEAAADAEGAFSTALTALSGSTTYYYCAFATNAIGTGYSQVQLFTTADVATLPAVLTLPATDISQTAARLGGEVMSDGNSPILSKGFYWGTDADPAGNGTRVASAATGDEFHHDLTGLTAGTTYYYCAYVENEVGQSLGEVQSFTTPTAATAPTVRTTQATTITETSARLSGSVTADGGSPLISKGFYWSTGSNPTEGGTRVVSPSTGDNFVYELTGLTAATTYYFCAYAENEVGISYGEAVSFVTSDATSIPTLSSVTVTGITTTEAVLSAEVTSSGGLAVTEKGFCYSSTNAMPTEADTKVVSAASGNAIGTTLTGLSPHTTYYVRAYAVNGRGTSLGPVRQFTTEDDRSLPTVQTGEVTAVGETTATFAGTLTADGGATVTSTGFCYATSPNPAQGGTRIEVTAEADGSFAYSATGLRASTTYYVCAYAQNAVGTAYGDVRRFTTDATLSVPAVGSTAVSAIATTTATASATLISDGGATVTERGFYLSTGNPPTAADTKIVSAATGNAITADLTGLSPNTRYYIRAYATNAQGTATGSINVFTTQDDRTAPTVGSITASNITAESVDLLATILADGGAAVTERGFCYTTNPDAAPTVADAKVVSAATGTDIAATLAGLTARTTYYIRAYATNGSRTGYSDVLRVTTSPSGVPDIGDNESPDM